MLKFLIVAFLGYFVVWPWIRRRWPVFTRKLFYALTAALVAVVLFKLLVTFTRTEPDGEGQVSEPPRAAPQEPRETP